MNFLSTKLNDLTIILRNSFKYKTYYSNSPYVAFKSIKNTIATFEYNNYTSIPNDKVINHIVCIYIRCLSYLCICTVLTMITLTVCFM